MTLLDIWKCFDQIVPVLARTLLGVAGMPINILWAYIRIMEEMKVANCLSLGVGETYRKSCSIPQGCPFSMAILALMTYPWIQLVKQQTGVIPRALADDLSLWARQHGSQSGEEDFA